MDIHEYQAKGLFLDYNIPVPNGKVAFSVQEAETVAKSLAPGVTVVKAQIHAGGRGKAGGVKLARKKEEVGPYAKELLGKILVTHQTGPQGREVKKVLIEEGADIAKELYVGFVFDRGSGAVMLIASTEGGMDIEEVAHRTPDKIVQCAIDLTVGYQAYQGRSVAFRLGLPKELLGQWVTILGNLYRFFVEKGALQVEINPLIVTRDNRLVALDAKVSFDDNALFRDEGIRALRDTGEEDPLETRALQYNLNYVKLDGEIGCMVNGAGLAMATMDVVQLAGGSPANFLDVGGGASKETVKQAFDILLSDKNVKGIFVNIFGGIVRCERIAGGIIDAAKEVKICIPVVVRLDGTNAKEAKQMLSESGLNLTVADTLWDGATTIVAKVGAAAR